MKWQTNERQQDYTMVITSSTRLRESMDLYGSGYQIKFAILFMKKGSLLNFPGTVPPTNRFSNKLFVSTFGGLLKNAIPSL